MIASKASERSPAVAGRGPSLARLERAKLGEHLVEAHHDGSHRFAMRGGRPGLMAEGLMHGGDRIEHLRRLAGIDGNAVELPVDMREMGGETAEFLGGPRGGRGLDVLLDLARQHPEGVGLRGEPLADHGDRAGRRPGRLVHVDDPIEQTFEDGPQPVDLLRDVVRVRQKRRPVGARKPGALGFGRRHVVAEMPDVGDRGLQRRDVFGYGRQADACRGLPDIRRGDRQRLREAVEVVRRALDAVRRRSEVHARDGLLDALADQGDLTRHVAVHLGERRQEMRVVGGIGPVGGGGRRLFAPDRRHAGIEIPDPRQNEVGTAVVRGRLGIDRVPQGVDGRRHAGLDAGLQGLDGRADRLGVRVDGFDATAHAVEVERRPAWPGRSARELSRPCSRSCREEPRPCRPPARYPFWHRRFWHRPQAPRSLAIWWHVRPWSSARGR